MLVLYNKINMKYFGFRQKGVTLIEVLIAISIISTIVIAVGFSVNTFVDARTNLLHNTRAVYLAEEGYEIIRALRDDSWSTLDALTLSDTHYLDVATSTIAFSGTQEVIDGLYYRSFVLSEVYRDGSSGDDITASTTAGATVDADMVEVTVSVFGPTGTTSLTAILSNLYAI